MAQAALFVRHKSRPGRRDDVRRVWEKHVKPHVQANPRHVAYYFCYDDQDPDTISVFQLYSDPDAMKDFMSGDWYPAYIEEVSRLVTEPPRIMPATLIWAKGSSPHEHG